MLDVTQLDSDLTQPGVGWHASEGSRAHIVFELHRPGLLWSVAGANLNSHKYALDYCLVPPGTKHADGTRSRAQEAGR